MILKLPLRQSEASARIWADAFLYRVSAMLPPDQKMVVNVEYGLSPIPISTMSGSKTTSVGFVDYTVVIAKDADAGEPC